MEQYSVTGMSCAACAARVEKAVSAVPGVTACAVNLLTNSMGVEGTAEPAVVIRAVENAGYGAAKKGAEPVKAEAIADDETPLRRRLAASLSFLLALMYVSMGHDMWGWPLPAVFTPRAAQGLLQLLLAGAVMVINRRFFISGCKGVLHGAPNMDTLVALGSAAAFIYSTCVLFALLGGGTGAAFYFESAAMILALITVGKLLEVRAKGRTTDALKSLMALSPKTATVLRDGQELTVPVEQVRRGDVFLVRPGEHIPVDGVVLEGGGAVDESALTGESVPVDKAAGSLVSAATVNRSGFLRCEARRVGEDTTLAQIVKMVSDAAATKAPIARLADRVSGVFVPVVIVIAVVTVAVWLLLGRELGFALARGISVLVISCPCALGLATPVAIMVGNGVGARHGILFKTALALENAGKTQIVALDKTGTITRGEPTVTDVLPCGETDTAALLRYAYALEKLSEHPLARAIVQRAEAEGLAPEAVTDFAALPGNGLRGRLAGRTLTGGSLRYISELAAVPEALRVKADALADEGKTPLLFALDDTLLGLIAVADVLKADSPAAIARLRGMGIRVVMLTGDNRHTAEAVGKAAGLDEVIAGVLPDGKAEAIRELKRQGRVAMVGDGINDAPALTAADVGIAIGAGTEVAIDAAEVVLMNSSLADVPAALALSRRTLRNIRENLFWAFLYNIIGIPLAAGVYGLELNPMFGAAAMSLSSFCVVSNALRLNFVKLRSDRAVKSKKREDITMKKELKIEGMMCSHCEANVKKTLEALPGVAQAEVSHTAGTAAVTLSAEVADAALQSAVEGAGYAVRGITSI